MPVGGGMKKKGASVLAHSFFWKPMVATRRPRKKQKKDKLPDDFHFPNDLWWYILSVSDLNTLLYGWSVLNKWFKRQSRELLASSIPKPIKEDQGVVALTPHVSFCAKIHGNNGYSRKAECIIKLAGENWIDRDVSPLMKIKSIFPKAIGLLVPSGGAFLNDDQMEDLVLGLPSKMIVLMLPGVGLKTLRAIASSQVAASMVLEMDDGIYPTNYVTDLINALLSRMQENETKMAVAFKFSLRIKWSAPRGTDLLWTALFSKVRKPPCCESLHIFKGVSFYNITKPMTQTHPLPPPVKHKRNKGKQKAVCLWVECNACSKWRRVTPLMYDQSALFKCDWLPGVTCQNAPDCADEDETNVAQPRPRRA